MTELAEHRWLGYRPVAGDGFIAVCSCGWCSPPQRTAGLAGALLDAHREEGRDFPSGNGTGDAAGIWPQPPLSRRDGHGDADAIRPEQPPPGSSGGDGVRGP